MSIEEKNVASVVIIGCLKSKDDTVEQQLGADVKANDTVSQTQNPKPKKKERRKTKTQNPKSISMCCDNFFERFNVGIWSSRFIGLDYMTNIVMGNHVKNLLFCFDQSICITTNFKTLENSLKPLFLKDLRRVWNRFGTCLTCGKRKYDKTNTLLVDDSPDKALCNPPHTGIFPFPYQYTDGNDSALGPDGELRKYLERLVDAENVQKFVEENPIGQTAITETHKSWSFYSKVIKAHKHK